MLAGAGRLDGRALMCVEPVDADVPKRIAKGPWQGIRQVRIAGRFRWDMLEMNSLAARRVPAAKFLDEPIDLQGGWRRGRSPGRMYLCGSHHAQALWIKPLVPTTFFLGHIWFTSLSRHVKACQGENPFRP